MPARDYRDIFGGAALILIGVFAVIYALTTMALGTVSSMGPGMFPTGLGVILAGFGVAILVSAMLRTAEMPIVDIRSLAAICASILIFAIMVRPFGLIPAIVVQTLAASRADSKLSLIGTAVVAASLALGATLIFRTGLGMQIAAIAWPW